MGGGNVAVGLREEGFDGELVLLGDEPEPPFGRPPLSKTYLRDEEELAGWMVKPADWYGRHDVELREASPVERIDPGGGRVVLTDGGEIRCDALCVATGCRPKVPHVPGVDLDGVFVLRTKADADAIKHAATAPDAVGRTVQLGTGVEISIGDLAKLLGEITGVVPRIETDPDRVRPAASEVERLVADPALARELLGWTPSVDLRAGLQRTVEWLRQSPSGDRAAEYVR